MLSSGVEPLPVALGEVVVSASSEFEFSDAGWPDVERVGGGGEVQDGTIECWRHGSRFDLATGAVLSLPAVEPVAVFAVRLVAGEVLVEVSPGGYPGPRDVDEGRGGGRDAGVV